MTVVTLATTSMGGAGVLCLACGAILVVWSFALWWEGSRAAAALSDQTLFEELATAHGLSPEERRILERAAEVSGFEESSFVFVRPEALDTLESLGELDAKVAESLRTRLYSEAAESAEESATESATESAEESAAA